MYVDAVEVELRDHGVGVFLARIDVEDLTHTVPGTLCVASTLLH